MQKLEKILSAEAESPTSDADNVEEFMKKLNDWSDNGGKNPFDLFELTDFNPDLEALSYKKPSGENFDTDLYGNKKDPLFVKWTEEDQKKFELQDVPSYWRNGDADGDVDEDTQESALELVKAVSGLLHERPGDRNFTNSIIASHSNDGVRPPWATALAICDTWSKNPYQVAQARELRAKVADLYCIANYGRGNYSSDKDSNEMFGANCKILEHMMPDGYDESTKIACEGIGAPGEVVAKFVESVDSFRCVSKGTGAYCHLGGEESECHVSMEGSGWCGAYSTLFHECGHAVFERTLESFGERENKYGSGLTAVEELWKLATDDLEDVMDRNEDFFERVSDTMQKYDVRSRSEVGKCFYPDLMSDDSTDTAHSFGAFTDTLQAISGDNRFLGHDDEYFESHPPPGGYKDRKFRLHEVVAQTVAAICKNDKVYQRNFNRVTDWVRKNMFGMKAFDDNDDTPIL